nr:MAG TPA: hypothetical protein [Caudoviricetes sp.]
MSLKFRTDDVIDLVHRKVVEFPRTRGGDPRAPSKGTQVAAFSTHTRG